MSRAERLAGAMAERELDALLVTDLVNVRYLTGYTGSNGLAIVGAGMRRFLTDFRYAAQVEREVPDEWARTMVVQDLMTAVPEQLPEGTTRLGFDDAGVSVRAHAKLADALPGVELVPAGGMVEALRVVKDDLEVARIRAAAQLADDALDEVLEHGLAGRTEREVAFALEMAMRRRGADGVAFDAIVAAAEHGALPHATPRNMQIPRDVLVTIDWGARHEGYCSDCTRTFATGDAIGDEAREIYALVLRAQQAALDAVAREIIDGAGHEEHFGHGLGHGVGLDVHEGPRLSRSGGDAALAAGNVVTVEPGVYLPGRLGVRIEDLVVVTRSGRDVLSTLPKTLQVIGRWSRSSQRGPTTGSRSSPTTARPAPGSRTSRSSTLPPSADCATWPTRGRAMPGRHVPKAGRSPSARLTWPASSTSSARSAATRMDGPGADRMRWRAPHCSATV